MDPKISALQNATNSAQLKRVVGDIPRKYAYYTQEVLQALLQKKHLIVDAPTADAVILFLSEFSGDRNRDLLQTAEIRDLIIDVLAPKIGEGHPIENLGVTICNITSCNKAAAELFSNRKSLSTILDCFHRATTATSAQWIASSIYSICYGNYHYNDPHANRILNDLPVVEAYCAMILCATTPDSVRWISESIDKILNKNEPARKLFGTLAFFENFKTMEKYATTYDAKYSFKNVVDLLEPILEYGTLLQSLRDASSSSELKDVVDVIPRNEKYFISEIIDVILQKQNLIVDAPSADAVVSFLKEFSGSYRTRDLLRTTEIRDLIIDVLVPKISEDDPVVNLGRMISSIVYYHKPAAELYSNRKSLSAILDCFHRATTKESVCCIVGSINNICYYNPEANKILNDVPFVEAYSAVIPYATRDDSVRWISDTLVKIWNSNEPAQKQMKASLFFHAFRALTYVTSDDAAFPLQRVFEILRPIVDSRVLTDAAVPSTTSTTENDALISQLRERLSQVEDSSKTERAAFENQLELERAEHQKTRDLLEQIRMELIKEKEAGQRRQREV